MRSWLVATALAAAAAMLALAARGEVGGPGDEGATDAEADSDAGSSTEAGEAPAVADAASDVAILADAAPGSADAGANSGRNSTTGFAFAVHGGGSIPFGRLRDHDIQDVLGYSIPVGVDLGFFITPHLFLGGYFVYGITSTSSSNAQTCPATENCAAQRIRFGVTAAWRFRPKKVVDPWAGLSFGYDIVNLTGTDASGATAESDPHSGLELGLQGGFDIRPAPFWGFGPYLEISGGHWLDNPNLYLWVTPSLRLFTLLSGF